MDDISCVAGKVDVLGFPGRIQRVHFRRPFCESSIVTETTANTAAAGDSIVTMDRRQADRRSATAPVSGDQPPRRKKQRRRQIDPTTCERDYSGHEIEFMQAMDAYKRAAGRMFPTCSEILEVIRSLGYVRLNEEQLALIQTDEFETSAETSAEAFDFNEDDFDEDVEDEEA